LYHLLFWEEGLLKRKHKAFIYNYVFRFQISLVAVRSHLRSAATEMQMSATNTVTFGPHNFAVAGPTTWNSLPTFLRANANTETVSKLWQAELTFIAGISDISNSN